MIVILTKDVKGLGRAGDVVKVNDGHARNLLIPKGMASEATDRNIRSLEKQKKLLEEKRLRDLAEAKALAEKLNGLTVQIATKSGENGRLFGSITAIDIAAALRQQHGLGLDKRKIELEAPIKTTGEHTVEVRIFSEVSATLTVMVEA
jgi:large subunit ribosomal protein L9